MNNVHNSTRSARRATTKRPRKPKTQWGDREGRRRDILAAARQLLERGGYEALNVRDVARGAGVSLGTVYIYFGSREEMFATLYAERLLQLDAELAPLCATATNAEELLVQIADRYLPVYRVFGRELNLWSLLVEANQYPKAVAAPLVQAARQVIATVMTAAERCARDGGVQLAAIRESPLLVPYVWATLSGLADHFTGKRHHLHAHGWDELVRFAARMIVAGMSSLAPPSRPNRRRR